MFLKKYKDQLFFNELYLVIFKANGSQVEVFT